MTISKQKPSDNSYSDEEAHRRFESALRGARIVGHKSYEDSKVGKPRAKPDKSPGKRKPVEKPA